MILNGSRYLFHRGFGKKTEVRDLTHETCYKFRLRFTMGQENSDWSPVTEVVTKSKFISIKEQVFFQLLAIRCNRCKVCQTFSPRSSQFRETIQSAIDMIFVKLW